jgi:hypothetical protein
MDRKGLAIMLLAAVVLLMLVTPQKSGYGGDDKKAPAVEGTAMKANLATAGAVSSADYSGSKDVSSASLIPREVVQTEDFGQFSPEKILSGQNYLDPRSQIGYPETLGGVLRNANQQFRSEPINPRTPVSIFNLSTIPPDTMRPRFEISPEYQ